ncbi:MAG TPA: ATP-binding protein [Acidimicrobiales bacterium]|nr:ATP-binding protein [Acidimicrobiales bacterium]
MSLRRRLVVGMLVLLVAAIATTDVVTLSSLRSFLFGRLDEQVDVAQSQAYSYIEASYQRAVADGEQSVVSDPGAWLAQLAVATGTTPTGLGDTAAVVTPNVVEPAAPSPTTAGPSGTAPSPTGTAAALKAGRLNPSVLSTRVSPDVYAEVLDAQGRVLFGRPSGSSDQPDPTPALPRHLPVRSAPPVHRFGTSHGVYLPDQPSFSAAAKGSGPSPYYRGEALAVPGGTLVTVIALAPAEQTLSSLTRVEVIVSLAVLVAVLLLTLAIVRFGLRPLQEMTATARAIAAGDMRRRVRRSDERSEVGRLGGALNGMLSQIEAAFAERTASESRLRRFVGDASHELRTPLTSIRGYAELLRKGALDDDAGRRRAAERIEHEAARMGVLVDDLLLLARLDQGRPLEVERVDLTRLVSEAVDAARAAQPGRFIVVDLAPSVTVEGDGGRLRQVIDNLLRNAVVHTPPGTAVRVSVQRHQERALLTVADEGPGMDEEHVNRAFDRFYRGAEARGRPGSGLGLSIVAALAAAHGGSASVRSTPGQGAEFCIDLPLGAVDRPPGDESIGPHGPTTAQPARR